LAAATLPKLTHAALSFAVMFVGISAFFFLLGAEFVGLVQIFVYIGAVAVLIVFHNSLTRPIKKKRALSIGAACLSRLLSFAGLVWAIIRTASVSIVPPAAKVLTVETNRRRSHDLVCLAAALRRCLAAAALIGALILVWRTNLKR